MAQHPNIDRTEAYFSKERIIIYLIAAIMGGSGNYLTDYIRPSKPDQIEILHEKINAINTRLATLEANQGVLMKWFYEVRREHRYKNP